MENLEKRIKAARDRMLAVREEIAVLRKNGLTRAQGETFFGRLQIATDEYIGLTNELLERKYRQDR